MRYIFFLVVIVIVGLATYLIYGNQEEGQMTIEVARTEVVKEGEINIGVSGVDTINPILSMSRDVQYLSKLIYRSLVKVTSDFRIEKDVVEEWSRVNPTTYLIRLREDVYWHDGSLMTAYDVKFTIEGIKNLSEDSIYKENVQHIYNVEVLDEYIMRVYLKSEAPFFEYMLTFPILSRETYDEDTLESKTEIPIGAGKFKISEIGERNIVLEKNTVANSGENTTMLERINIKIYQEYIELYNNLSRENIDLVNTTNIEYENHIGTIGFRKHMSQGREFDYLAINNTHSMLSNKEVRRAINYAIDKNSLVYNVFRNKYFVSNFPLDYGSYLYNGAGISNEHSVDRARRIIENHSWEEELEFELIVNENHINRIQVAELIGEQLGDVGIKINIRKTNNSTFENYITNGNYELILTGSMVSLYPDLTRYFGLGNLFNYHNEEIINLLAEINNIQDSNLLRKKYRRIIEIYNEEIPFVSLYFNSNILIMNKRVRGNISHTWHNLFYNINTWHRIRE